MTKARDLADFVSAGNPLADGTLQVADISDLTATAAELNTLDGITATTSELNGVAGINTNVQTQLDLKAPLASPTLTGTVTIGGTTYPTSDGTEGQVLTTNGSGAVSFSDPAGGGSADFVASGSIANGDVVVLNSNGTVSVAAETGNATETMGTKQSLVGDMNYMTVAYDSVNNKIVVAYRDGLNSNYGTVVVGSITGTTITFGTPVVFNSSAIVYTETIFDSSSGKIVIVYYKNDSVLSAIVGTVSGTSITFGSITTFGSISSTGNYKSVYVGNSKIVVSYRNNSDSSHGYAVVGTVSGTSISFGSISEFNNAVVTALSIAYDSGNDKVVISYRDDGNSQYGTAVVGTVSGTSITFGTPVVFEASSSTQISSSYDESSQKVLIFYTASTGYGIVGTVSGTSISFGTRVQFESGLNPDFFSSVFNTRENETILMYRQSSVLYFTRATVSGTSVSFTSRTAINGGTSGTRSDVAYSRSNNSVFFSFRDNLDDVAITVYQFQQYTSNASSYIGVASEAISNTATGAITIDGGVNEGQTGLTIGSTYYVADDGSLSTTNNGRKIGRAISATKLLVNSNMSGDEMDEYLGGLV